MSCEAELSTHVARELGVPIDQVRSSSGAELSAAAMRIGAEKHRMLLRLKQLVPAMMLDEQGAHPKHKADMRTQRTTESVELHPCLE